MAHICCKAGSDASHTVTILDVARGSIQQPAHNPVALQTCCSQSHFLPYMLSSEWNPTTHDIITTPTEANRLYTQTYFQLTEAKQHFHWLRFNSAQQHCLHCIHQTLTLGNETRQVPDISQPHLSHLQRQYVNWIIGITRYHGGENPGRFKGAQKQPRNHMKQEFSPSFSVIRKALRAILCIGLPCYCFHVTFLSVVELCGDCTIIMHDIKLGVCPYACQSVEVCQGWITKCWSPHELL